ncbi:MAG: DUF2029 domain-containing protein [Candidatus Lokiarchaeota archaeon]|nr:DUF2029 domain-containing protein [Candidatus Lokiarchaeota archaeon]
MTSNFKEISNEFPRNMVLLLIATTIFFILSRILIIYFDFPYLIEASRDNDFRNLVRWNQNGLENFPPYYLYFWYFIFFPFGVLESFISMLIWDILRLIVTSYVAYKAYFMITYRIDQLAIYLFIYIGFINDAYYGNCNFVVMLFFFLSYKYLEKDQKWASGIFFALATFKINSIIYLPVLLILKKIKLKEVFYYLIPFGILLLPYLIFPDYTIQLIINWSKITPGIGGTAPAASTSADALASIITLFNSILTKAVQPSQFLYFSIIIMIFLQSIINNKRHTQIRKALFALIAIFSIYIVIFAWLIPLFTYYIWLVPS